MRISTNSILIVLTSVFHIKIGGADLLPGSLVSEECTPDASILDLINLNIPAAFLTCASEVSELENKKHPDIGKSTEQIITSYGYPVEIHNVITEDGYNLTIHRIPNSNSKQKKAPVYLQHGLGGCSDNWVLLANNSLAFILAEAGHEIYLGNFRGTSYSLGHTALKWDNPNDFSYWNFSWHEMGRYDIPAFVSFITKFTGFPKIYFVAHSMGTSAFLVGMSVVPEILNSTIKKAILLTTAGFMGRSTNAVRLLAPLATMIDPEVTEDPFKAKYFLKQENVFKGRIENADQYLKLMNTTQGSICTPTAIRCGACAFFIFAFFGFDATNMNYTLIPNLPDRFPNIMSVKSLYHYAQSINDCTFRQFDYGAVKNKEIYNSDTPPDYTMPNCKVPVHSFYANFDNFCRPKDVQRTMNLLPKESLKENTMIDSTYFNHVDVIIAKGVVPLLYTKILSIIQSE